MSDQPSVEPLDAHRQEEITTSLGTFSVDAGLVHLITALHAAGARTLASCQGSPPPPPDLVSDPDWAALTRSWSQARTRDQRLAVLVALSERRRREIVSSHAYVFFATPDNARRGHTLLQGTVRAALSADAPTTDRSVSREMLSRMDHHANCLPGQMTTARRAQIEHLLQGSFAAALSAAEDGWCFEAAEGRPDVFAVRFALRWPHDHAALLNRMAGSGGWVPGDTTGTLPNESDA